jgi:hypothetical protein
LALRGLPLAREGENVLLQIEIDVLAGRTRQPPRDRKFAVSLLEERGFEPLVPATWTTRSRPSLSPGLSREVPYSYGTKTGEVPIFSPTPAMIIVGVTVSPPVM